MYWMGEYIKKCVSEDCVLLIWVTNPKLDIVMNLIKTWGFSYRTKFLEWIKMENEREVVNPGKYTTNCMESLLIASMGNIN